MNREVAEELAKIYEAVRNEKNDTVEGNQEYVRLKIKDDRFELIGSKITKHGVRNEEMISKEEVVEAVAEMLQGTIGISGSYYSIIADYLKKQSFNTETYTDNARKILSEYMKKVGKSSKFNPNNSLAERIVSTSYQNMRVFSAVKDAAFKHIIFSFFEIASINKVLGKYDIDTSFIDKHIEDLCDVCNLSFFNIDDDLKNTVLGHLLGNKNAKYSKELSKSHEYDSIYMMHIAEIFINKCMSKQKLLSFINENPNLFCNCKKLLDVLSKNFELGDQLSQELNHETIIALVFNGEFSADLILKSDMTEEEILSAVINEKGQPLYSADVTEKICKLFEAGRVSLNSVKTLAKVKYLSADELIRLYDENESRKISVELGETTKESGELILAYFTPRAALKAIEKNPDSQNSAFYKETLQQLYKSNGQNLARSFIDLIKNESNNDAGAAYDRIIKLYQHGYIGKDALDYAGLSEQQYIKDWKDNGSDEKKLVDLVNTGFISEEFVQDSFDEDQIFDLISKGMRADVIAGFYSTAELIELAKPRVVENPSNPNEPTYLPPRLTLENLAELKGDIVTGVEGDEIVTSKNGNSTLLDLYLKGKIGNAKLFQLADVGVISLDDAQKINEQFDIKHAWDELRKKGIIGSPTDGMSNSLNTGNGGYFATPINTGTVGIDESSIWDFYDTIGVTEYLKIDEEKCPVFKDYIVMPVFDWKVAYLEYKDGRTYIVPLNIVLEQINNPNGDLDLMGKACGRNDFNSNKEYIRNANHCKNWARNILLRTAELPQTTLTMEDARRMIEDENSEIRMAIDECSKSYDDRKYKR